MNRIFCHSSEHLAELADGSVALTVTSPPYGVGIAYGGNVANDTMPLEDLLALYRRVFAEVWRVTVDGGRVCINVANTGRNPYVPLMSYVDMLMLDLGFWMRGHVVWVKAAAPNSTAWGSWQKATNPTLRDPHEFIGVYSKGSAARSGGHSTLSRQDFIEGTGAVWYIQPETDRRHPAPFPLELPRRLINLYSFEDDLVLDPFAGSGTTALAAKRAGRQYVGYEKQPEYALMAENRLMELWDSMEVPV